MDRQIVYPGAIPLETDLLNTNRSMMVALSGIAKALFGSSTIVNGLVCAPTAVPSMQVAVGAGEIYSQANLDDTAFSSLSADTIHQIMKQGVSLDTVNLSCPAPLTAGTSICYLIEVRFVEADLNPVTLPYYNSANPSTAFSGPSNSGIAQPTTRAGTISIVAKAGVAATTGSQVAPAADAGYVGLWVVTVANGATSIASGNIAALAGAPFVPVGGIVGSISATAYASRAEGLAGTAVGKAVSPDVMGQSVQAGAYTYGSSAGSANAVTVALTPSPAAIVAGMSIRVLMNSTNTAAATLSVNGFAAAGITLNGGALTGGELVAGQIYTFIYDGSAWEVQPTTAMTSALYPTKAAVQKGGLLYAAAVGSANALSATLSPAPSALQAGMTVVLQIATTNTGAATLNLNSLGVKSITAGSNALQAGMLLAGQMYAFIFDGTNWQLQSPTQTGIVAYNYGASSYWELYANGKIEQGGALSIGSGSNVIQTPLTFPTPFQSLIYNINGNPDGPPNGSWSAMTVTCTPTGLTGCIVTCDTANSGQSIAAGRRVYWRATGK